MMTCASEMEGRWKSERNEGEQEQEQEHKRGRARDLRERQVIDRRAGRRGTAAGRTEASEREPIASSLRHWYTDAWRQARRSLLIRRELA